MLKLTIRCVNESFEIKDHQIINLENKLNIMEYGRDWKDIISHLYKFHTLNGYESQPIDILEVNKFQYNFLYELKDKC